MQDEIALIIFVICFFAYWICFFLKLKNILGGFIDYDIGGSLINTAIGTLAFGFDLIIMLQYPNIITAFVLLSISFVFAFFVLLGFLEFWYCKGQWKGVFDGIFGMKRA